jgi:hypothetical protein
MLQSESSEEIEPMLSGTVGEKLLEAIKVKQKRD